MKDLLLILAILIAGFFRFTGFNWDQGQHLHPDERFLTLVALDLRWPDTFAQYFDTAASPANPHNTGHNFFVYGTYPVLLVKLVSEMLHQYNYTGLTLIGRQISALFDLGTVVLVYLISLRLFSRFRSAYLATLCYAISVLPIQLSHFFANDTFLVFFLILTLYLLLHFYHRPTLLVSSLLGISFGMAFSAKINAVLVLPVISLAFLVLLFRKIPLPKLFLSGLLFLLTAFYTIRLAYPYLSSGFFSLNPRLLSDWSQLARFSQPDFYYPPGVQWVHITPAVFPLLNLTYWGLGLPLAFLSFVSVILFIFKFRRSFLHLSLIVFCLTIFIYQSLQFAQAMRYFYPLYPILAVTTGWLLSKIKSLPVLVITLVIISVYPLSFLSIYFRPHTRVSASAWIFRHLPPGSVISCEYWDDCLPYTQPIPPYQTVTLSLYDPDSPAKWREPSQKISSLDYIILTSNRLYGSIASTPEHYPQSSRYYQLLFSGRLGFANIAQFASRPSLSFPLPYCLDPSLFTYGRISASPADCDFPGISFVDDYADETFTVYDHPKVTIFKNHLHLNPNQIYDLVFSNM